MDENLKLRFRVGKLDLPERKRYTSTRAEEEEKKQNCPCGKAMEGRIHEVGECELYMEERDALEGGMRDLNKGGMKSFDALDSWETTIAVLGDRWWPQTANQDGDKICIRGLCVVFGRNVMSTSLLEVSLLSLIHI